MYKHNKYFNYTKDKKFQIYCPKKINLRVLLFVSIWLDRLLFDKIFHGKRVESCYFSVDLIYKEFSAFRVTLFADFISISILRFYDNMQSNLIEL